MCKNATPVDAQLLLPTEESTLRPLTAIPDSENEEAKSKARIAPSLWTIPALGVPLADAVPWLASLDPATLPPALRLFAAAGQLADKMVRRGDFAPAPEGVLEFIPFWKHETQWLVAALAGAGAAAGGGARPAKVPPWPL